MTGRQHPAFSWSTFCRGRFKDVFQLSRESRHIGTGPSHVDRNEWAAIVASLRVANDASRRTT